MGISSLTKHIFRAIEALPNTARYAVETFGNPIGGQSGYSFRPSTISNRSWLDSTTQSDVMYAITDPSITELNGIYTISFTFGEMTYGAIKIDDYFIAGMQVDKATGALIGEPVFQLHSGGSVSDPLSDFPPPPILSGVPNPVNDGLKIFSYSQEVNTWIKEHSYDDPQAARLMMGSYLIMVVEQIVMGIETYFYGQPKNMVDLIAQRAAPLREYIRTWPGKTGSVGGDWSENAWFDSSFNDTSLRFWRPTVLTYAESWMMLFKIDHSNGMHTDDHMTFLMEGTFDSTNFRAGKLVLGPVYGVSSLTRYKSSGDDVFYEVITEAGEDVLQTWANGFVTANMAQPADLQNVATGAVTYIQGLIEQMRTLSGSAVIGEYDVSNGGSGDVHFAADGEGAVFAGCSGRVFKLSTQGSPVIEAKANTHMGNHSVRMTGGLDKLIAGCNGTLDLMDADAIATFDSDNAVPIGSCDGRTSVLALGSKLFAGCDGYVVQLDINNFTGGYTTYSHLETIEPDVEKNEVRLATTSTTLYASSHGFVFAYDITGEYMTPVTNGSKLCFDLSEYGNTATPMAVSNRGEIFVSVNAYVIKLDLQSFTIAWAVDLETIKSSIGENIVDLIYLGGGVLLAGCNGYAVRLRTSDGGVIRDQSGAYYYSIHDGSHGITSLAHNGGGGLAACNGYVYYLNPNHYNVSNDPGDAVGATISKQVVALTSDENTSVFCFGGAAYVGVTGKVYSLPAQ